MSWKNKLTLEKKQYQNLDEAYEYDKKEEAKTKKEEEETKKKKHVKSNLFCSTKFSFYKYH